LFDLCFVVSMAALVVELHHAVVKGHPNIGALHYVLLFLPICWAWMQFAWFATAYDNDDIIYRLFTLGQMAGVLALTATIPAAFDGNMSPFALCYALMRIPLVLKWARAARRGVDERVYARRWVIGLPICQVAWVALLAIPVEWRMFYVPILMGLELAVPSWAMAVTTRRVFHVRHITERFGLFALIVLGESILAATTAIKESLKEYTTDSMVIIGVATLLSAFCVWWLYFDVLDGRAVTLARSRVFWWGHGHLLAFGAIGAMGAGAEIAVQVQAESLPFDLPVRLAVVAPAGLSVLALAWIHSSTAQGWSFSTVTRVLATLPIMIVGVAGGDGGPAGATVAVALVLLLQAIAETAARGRRERRTVTAFAWTQAGQRGNRLDSR
jgi:low temperature requirement protein LtrA